MKRILSSRWVKPVVFLAALAPLLLLVWQFFHDGLGANPLQFITHATGDWTLRFLVFTLAVTPLRKLLNLPDLIRFRRMLGLYAFFYGCLHLMTYLWFDKFFDWADIVKDIAKRPYITIGTLGLVLMIPLAITSTVGWIRRMGGKRWQMLHRLTYVSIVAGVIHYYWLVKLDVSRPLFYGGLTAILLLYRVAVWFMKSRARRVPAPVAA
ncbi:protein-methionine-sulfoxide reductase heme-binding subunit MsrQ [Paludibaculum fermentans]|uniref:Protein-methionine-sulfoxide reductase heme-binding subunit MsrQ n=1 Tax=Paludibaculum fermentans TaxID=1473598 RepID=A0A7S7SJN5_PALFE|nr:protein-methionine-sulfoxide reductase heme-binding subunit MsrQ [Paludibaculum fermentans]QOY86170.1 sulfoxide reductase heme-binding subunit YedZ [Paludibaculum fermentans]